MKADWEQLLAKEMAKPYFQQLQRFVEEEYATQQIFPPFSKRYAALELCGFKETGVLLLGQDPYHGPRQAHGLSFSVADKTAKFPPSLRNIFAELEADTGVARTNPDLSDWATQGVLLLNTVLTVRAGQAASHRGKGWERFTDEIIRLLNQRDEPVIFVLWGGDAQKKQPLITGTQHKIITSVHPSPLSAYRGFLGSKPFSRINVYRRELGQPEIVWGDLRTENF